MGVILCGTREVDLQGSLRKNIWSFQMLLRIMNGVHGGCTPLSSRTPRARQKYLFFLSCISKTGKTFINYFSWVDIHNIYYIVKICNQILWYFLKWNILFPTRMMQNWTKTITIKMKMAKNLKILLKKYYQWLCIRIKIIIISKIIYAI